MVKRMQLGKVNAYLIIEGTRAILVDAGTRPRHAKRIEASLVAEGIGLEDLSLIIVTHVHYDHVGALKRIRQRSGAPLLVHSLEKETLESGSTAFPRGTLLLTRLLSYIANRLPGGGTFEPVEADILLEDELDLTPFGVKGKVLHTPGHTPGALTVYLEEGACLVGDTLFHLVPGKFFPPFAEDENALWCSLRLLRDLDVDIFYPGHGQPIEGERFDHYMNRKERRST